MSQDVSTGKNNNQLTVSFSSKQSQYNFLVAKLERVSQALYLLTNHLPYNEPFRINLRNQALELIDDLYEVQTRSSLDFDSLNRLIQNRFNEMESVLLIGQKVGLVSDMNLNVLKEQMDLIRHNTMPISDHVDSDLNDTFFETSKRHEYLMSRSAIDKKDVYIKVPTEPNKFSAIDSSGNDDKQTEVKPAETNRPKRRHGTNHSKRRRAILDLFKDKEEIDINDVQSVIEGCSQKTMQRELKSMVLDELIIKKGKRRWSTYLLGKDVDLNQELS